MSILIKGMEMPNSCWDCYFQDCGNCVLNRHKAVDKCILDDCRDEDCPLVAVPDHGRLIDADALADQMAKRRSYVGRLSDPLCLIEDAPTTIEAEGENNG